MTFDINPNVVADQLVNPEHERDKVFQVISEYSLYSSVVSVLNHFEELDTRSSIVDLKSNPVKFIKSLI